MLSASAPGRVATIGRVTKPSHQVFVRGLCNDNLPVCCQDSYGISIVPCRRCQRTRSILGPGRKMAEASISVPYTDLDQGIERLLQLPGPHFVVFLADPNPSTGVSWCPDCVRCGPAVKQFMADRKASLLEVLVGQRPVWKDPKHPLRQHPQIKLSGVPDLMRWSVHGPTARMGSVLEEASSPQEAVALVARFFMTSE